MKSVLTLYSAILIGFSFSMEKAIACAPGCSGYPKKISEFEGEIKRYKVMLEKNEDYLRNNTEMDSSLRHKVKSNLFLIQTKLEFFSDNIELLSQQLNNDCKECANGKTESKNQ